MILLQPDKAAPLIDLCRQNLAGSAVCGGWHDGRLELMEAGAENLDSSPRRRSIGCPEVTLAVALDAPISAGLSVRPGRVLN